MNGKGASFSDISFLAVIGYEYFKSSIISK